MTEYNFQLIFKLDKPDDDPERYLDILYESGCDDATIGMGMTGFISLDFIRETDSALVALESAYRNVKKAIPNAILIRAEPYLLNLSELAFMFGCTKQNLRKYARGEVATVNVEFPLPMVSGKTNYWLVAEVTKWLHENSAFKVSNETLEMLFAVWSLNQAIETLHQPNPRMTATFRDILRSVA